MNANTPNTAPSATGNEVNASVIRALHARFEAASNKYLAIEAAERDNVLQLDWHFTEAMRINTSETDTLRTAILHQVPDTWADALILQYHIVCAFDLFGGGKEYDQDEDRVITRALYALFDFMCCEAGQDKETFGGQFASLAKLAFNLRRFRTGIVEG